MSLTKVSYSLIEGAPFNTLDYGADPTGVADSTSAFTAAFTAADAVNGTVYVSSGTYLITNSLELPENCALVFAPSVIINFNSTAFHVLRVRKGAKVLGNGVKINITNASWDGGAILLDGADRFADDNPTYLSGITVIGNDKDKGTGLYLTAKNAAEFISFVRFANFSFYTLNYGLTLDAGSSGSAGTSSTWHWVNANTFDNFTFYGTKRGFSAIGLTTVPAEVAGNTFNNFMFQVNAPGVCAYFDGASKNVLSAFIWDWDYGLGDAIVFANSAGQNQIFTNLEYGGITAPGTNLINTFSGTRAGPFTIQNTADISYLGQDIKIIFDDQNKSYITNPREGLSNKLVFGTGNANRVAIGQGGAVQFIAYGAGTLTTDASGNITASSDERIKKNIRPYNGGLPAIQNISPILYGFTEKSELDQTKDDYVGFSAQNVQAVIPEAIGATSDGVLTLNDRAIVAALVNAVKELALKIEDLETRAGSVNQN